jgi:hypothetical protein
MALAQTTSQRQKTSNTLLSFFNGNVRIHLKKRFPPPQWGGFIPLFTLQLPTITYKLQFFDLRCWWLSFSSYTFCVAHMYTDGRIQSPGSYALAKNLSGFVDWLGIQQ